MAAGSVLEIGIATLPIAALGQSWYARLAPPNAEPCEYVHDTTDKRRFYLTNGD
jgi:hypothetical protein